VDGVANTGRLSVWRISTVRHGAVGWRIAGETRRGRFRSDNSDRMTWRRCRLRTGGGV